MISKKIRALSFVMALLIILGTLVPGIAEANPETPARQTENQASGKIYEDNIKPPVIEPIEAGNTQIKGVADPSGDLYLSINGSPESKVEVTYDVNGNFTYEIPALTAGQTIKARTVKVVEGLEKTSPTQTFYVYAKEGVKGKGWHTAIVSGTSFTDSGYFEEGVNKYLKVRMYSYAVSEPYLVLLNSKMYLQVDPDVAEYIEKITVQPVGLGNYEERELVKNTTEIPGADNVWETPIVSSENGFIIDALVGSKNADMRIYLKPETPQEIIEKGIAVRTWARKLSSGRADQLIENFNKNFITKKDTREYSPDNFYVKGDNSPVVDYANYDDEENSIFAVYRVEGKTYSLYAKNKPYSIYIDIDPEVLPFIDIAKIKSGQLNEKKNLPEKDVDVLSNVKIITDGNGKEQIQIEGIYKPEVEKGQKYVFDTALINRQDKVLVLPLIEGKSLKDIVKKDGTAKIPISIEIRDNGEKRFNDEKATAEKAIGKIGDKYQKPFLDAKAIILDKWFNPHVLAPTVAMDIEENPGTEELKPAVTSKEFLSWAAKYPTPENIQALKDHQDDIRKDIDSSILQLASLRARIKETWEALEALVPFVKETNANKPMKNTQGSTFAIFKDSDRDGLTDKYEKTVSQDFNFTNPDTDGDGKLDGEEVAIHKTDPLVAPYNWYDKDGKEIKELTLGTKTISGKIYNNSPGIENVYPRTIKIVDKDTGTVIAETTSNEDLEGTWSVDVTGKLKDKQKIVVQIFTKEIVREIKIEKKKEDVTVQNAYENPEVSSYLEVGVVYVDFDLNGGTVDPAIEKQSLAPGGKATKPATDPIKEGFTFKHWALSTETGPAEGAFDFANTAVDKSITLVAVWQEEKNTTPVAKAPVLKEVNAEQPNIVISSIDENANKLEVKKGEEVVATLTKDADGNWTSSDATNYPVTENKEIGELTVTPSDTAKTALEGQDIKVTASNTNEGATPTSIDSNIVNYDTSAPSVPTITAPKTGDTEVEIVLPTDAVAGDTVIVKVGTETKEIVLTDKNITDKKVSVPVEALAKDTVITASVKDKAGNESEKATATVVDKEASVVPTDVKQEGNKVVGKVPVGTTGEVKLVDPTTGEPILVGGKEVKGTIDEEGNITVDITNVPEGTKVAIEVTEAGKTPSKGGDVILDKTAPSVPTITAPKTGDTEVEIVLPTDAVAGDTVIVKVGTETKELVLTDKNITDKKVSVPVEALAKDTVITASIKDKAGNESEKATATVVDKEVSAVPTDVKQEGNKVVGKVPVGTTGEVKLVDPTTGEPILVGGKEVKGTIDEEGNITVDITNVPEGTKVAIEVTEAGKTPSKGGDVILDKTAPSVPTITAPKTGDTEVEIVLPTDAVAGDTVIVKVGTETKELVLTDKNITDKKVSVPVEALAKDTVITASIKDKAGNESEKATATVVDKEVSAVPTDVKQEGNKVVGKVPVGTTGEVKLVDPTTGEPILVGGKEVKGTIDEEGNITVDITNVP
ncbi:MAG: InlB B-repeat-containing protein, partial [Tissierellia bacterium]|nr:InlB B-repeat-containing protein [Tissierellia bacterium]